ncbi:MAG: VanZ family protein [Bacteroidetes bacterium]|nr:VanZ family protein [Bacteroidota bacterium]
MRFLKYHLPFWLFAAAIFAESSIPGDRLPEIAFKVSDKVIHLAIFLVLYIVAARMFSFQNKYTFLKKNFLISALVVTAIYGAADEFHQFFVPNRSCDFFDFVFDVLGGITGLILLYYTFYKRKNNLVIQND